MRYKNPFYMAENAGRGRPHRRRTAAAWRQPRLVRAGDRRLALLPLRVPPEGRTDADKARRNVEVFLDLLCGKGFAEPSPRPMTPNPLGLPGLFRARQSGKLSDRLHRREFANDLRRRLCHQARGTQGDEFKKLKADEAIARADTLLLTAQLAWRRLQRAYHRGDPDPGRSCPRPH